jgi:mercuric ion binding protein
MRSLALLLTLPLLAQPALAAVQTTRLAVANMSCALCGPTVRIAASRVAGVSEITIDVDGGMATVTFEDTLTGPAAIAEAITSAGYPATPVLP